MTIFFSSSKKGKDTLSQLLKKPFSTLSIFIVLMTGCCTDCPIVEDEDTFAYYTQSKTQEKSGEIDEKLAVYIDYSNGMHDAVNQTYTFFEKITNIVDRGDAIFYKVGKGAPMVMNSNIFEPGTTFNPRNPDNFLEKRSHLKKALDRIVSNSTQQAIFITDFERVPDDGVLPKVQFYGGRTIKTNIDFSPWATKSFELWLDHGGAVDVFAHTFRESNAQEERRLFFIVFTPEALVGVESPESVFWRLQEEGETQKNTYDRAWFNFSQGSFSTKRVFKPQNQGGIHDEIAPLNSLFGEDWDYYLINYSDIEYVMQDEEEDAESSITLFTGLSLERVGSSFINPTFSIKVYSAKSEYLSLKALWIEDSVSAFKYGTLPKTPDVFFSAFDKDEQTIEITFNSEFQGMTTDCELYKVEVWIESCDLNIETDNMNRMLQWTDLREGGELVVSSLNMSLQEAMKRQRFEPKKLHTLYFEISNN